MTRPVAINGTVTIGGGNPLVVIAGPCVIETEELTLRLAEQLKKITGTLGVPFIFKSSYDKANRTSLNSYRGPGLEQGLRVLSKVKRECGVPVLSDVHHPSEVEPAAEVLDVIQIPAFLCRQTDLVVAAARRGKPVNVKKGQFLSPFEMEEIAKKITAHNNPHLMLTERGTSFGYNNLVVDMRSLLIMREFGFPVVFDATHSVQLPGARGDSSGGNREFIGPLACAAAAVGIDGLYLEVHETPEHALCDGPNSLRIDEMAALLEKVVRIAALNPPCEAP